MLIVCRLAQAVFFLAAVFCVVVVMVGVPAAPADVDTGTLIFQSATWLVTALIFVVGFVVVDLEAAALKEDRKDERS